jgi:hypothetical protein
VGTIVSSVAVWQFFWGLTLVARDVPLELLYDAWTLCGTVDGRRIEEHLPHSGYAEQVATFLTAIETGTQALIRSSYRDACATFATTLAANRSLASGQPEKVLPLGPVGGHSGETIRM